MHLEAANRGGDGDGNNAGGGGGGGGKDRGHDSNRDNNACVPGAQPKTGE